MNEYLIIGAILLTIIAIVLFFVFKNKSSNIPTNENPTDPPITYKPTPGPTKNFSTTMAHTTYYANWGQFWNGGATYVQNGNPIKNCPATYENFIGAGQVDKIIFGVLMFGITANPTLRCASLNFFDTACQFTKEFSFSNMAKLALGFAIDAVTEDIPIVGALETIYSDSSSIADFLNFFKDLIMPPDIPVYMSSGSYYTFPMYPNMCFTGSDSIVEYEILDGLITVIDPLWAGKCPSKGRLDDYNAFSQLAAVKAQNPGLKTIASYGGWTWTHGPGKFYPASQTLFTQMISSQENRAQFIKGSYEFLTLKGFDGADFDWEYPGENNSPIDFYGFEQLIKEFKAAYPNFILSMQCSGFLSWDAKYTNPLPGYGDITMANDLDYFKWINRLIEAGLDDVNIMAYDYYTAVSENTPIPKNGTAFCTRPNTPMYCGLKTDPEYTNLIYPWINPQLKSSAYNIPIISTENYEYSQPRMIGNGTACTQKYQVRKGDSYASISAKYPYTTVAQIEAANPKIPEGQLQEGDILNIPCAAPEPVTTKPPTPTGIVPDINSGVGECLLKTLTIMQKALGPNMKKVKMGLACYGRSFSGVNFSGLTTQEDIIQNSVGLPCTLGGWEAGSDAYVDEKGVLTYYDIVETFKSRWTNMGYNQKYGISVAVDTVNGIWVSYDDPVSIAAKINLAKSFGIGGVMSFTPQQDDWKGGYPIISAIGQNLNLK